MFTHTIICDLNADLHQVSGENSANHRQDEQGTEDVRHVPQVMDKINRTLVVQGKLK